MTDGPSLKISVDATGAKSGSDQATQSFDKIKKKAAELNEAINKVDASLDKTGKEMEGIASSSNNASAPINKLSGGFLAAALAADKLAVAEARASLANAKLAGDKTAVSAAKQALAQAQAAEATNKASKAFEDFNNKLHPTSPAIDRVRDAFGRMANGIAIIDGPLGGVASRITAFNSLLGKVTPGMIGFTVAAATAGFVISKSLGAYERYEASFVKLDSVLKITGRDSELTAQQISKLGDDIDGFTASRENVIDTVAAISTFHNIKTSEIEHVVKIANDLSQVFGGSLQQNAMKVAKALNAPGEALGLLERMGINFNKQQEETLRLMEETGHIAEAQRIILFELAKVEGVAAGQANTLKKAKDDLKDSLNKLSIEFASNTGITNAYEGAIVILTKSLSFLKEAADITGTVFSKIADIAIIAGARVGLLDQEVIKLAKDHLYNGETHKNIAEIGKAATGAATKISAANPELDKFTKKVGELRLEAERMKNGGLTDAAKKFKEELARLNEDKKAEVQGFGLDQSDKELAKFEATIRKNQKAFDELGESGRKSAEQIRESFANLKKKEMTKPIDDYVKNAEFNFKKVNEIIVRSGETFLDALTDPYKQGETAAQRWKNVVASVLRDVAKEIIRTQIIAGAVKFTSGLFASAFGPTSTNAPAAMGPQQPFASAMGNAFQNGRIIPHAMGGIVDRAGAFPMAGGNIGTIAEGNKAEGILPLKRNSQGQLGVIAQGSSSSGGNFSNTNIIHVDGSSGGDERQNQALGKSIAKEIDARTEQIIARFVMRQSKTNGVFNGARA